PGDLGARLKPPRIARKAHAVFAKRLFGKLPFFDLREGVDEDQGESIVLERGRAGFGGLGRFGAARGDLFVERREFLLAEGDSLLVFARGKELVRGRGGGQQGGGGRKESGHS